MEIVLLKEAEEDLIEYKKAGDKASLLRIKLLIENIQITPYEGLGKPEMLKFELSGKWSRRINKEDRMVYEIIENKIILRTLKGHYK